MPDDEIIPPRGRIENVADDPGEAGLMALVVVIFRGYWRT